MAKDEEGYFHRIAFVTFTVAVDLASTTPLDNEHWWKATAVENAVYHPALQAGYLADYVERIVFEEEERP